MGQGGPSSSAFSLGEKGPARLAGDGGGGGVSTGPIWPCLALFTPSREAENETGVDSFATPLLTQ